MENTFTITLTEEEMKLVFISIISRACELKEGKKEEECKKHCKLAEKFQVPKK